MNRELITTSLSMKKIVAVPIDLISKRDVNPRKSGLLMDNVDRLVIAEDFPEIHLGLLNDEYIIVDGYHRFAATQRLEREAINAFITEFDNIDDLKKQAFISNVNHGIKLSDLDMALNIYEFYLTEVNKNTTAKLVDIIKNYEIPERRGRQLFYWTVFNKEVLGNSSIDLSNITKYEDYNKLLLKRNEVIGSVSDTFKDEFKEFYDKYDHLTVVKKREAINYFLEGKDYYEEIAKIEEEERKLAEEEKAKFEESIERIDETDAVDRMANVSYETSDVKSNPTIEKLNEEAQEAVEKLEEIQKEDKKKFESITAMVKKNSETFMLIKQLQERKKIKITREDYNELQGIMDVIDSIISDIDPKSFGEMI